MGSAAGILVALFAGKGDKRGWVLVRCTMGFLVAVVWIMAIADEVVDILQVSKANMSIWCLNEHTVRPPALFLDYQMRSLV